MKNILFLFSMCFLVVCSAVAQVTTPRYGVGKNQDNTGRTLTYAFVNTAEVAGPDTLKVTPNAFNTLIIPSNGIIDSIAISIKTLATSYAGDRLEFSFNNTAGSGHKVRFIGTAWEFSSSGQLITLTASKKATITFRFDGAKWLETGRTVQ